MGKPHDGRHKDLFRPPLDQIVNPDHPLVRLGRQIDWGFIKQRLGAVYADGPRQPPLASRLVAGLLILKHMHSQTDEALCARWIENPYYH